MTRCFFTGKDEGTEVKHTIFHGVGVVINHTLRTYVEDVEAINARLMTIKLRVNIDIQIQTHSRKIKTRFSLN